MYAFKFQLLVLVICSCYYTGEMIISNDKYTMTEINNSYYSVQMRLVIRNFCKTDLGGYKCISKNSIGDAEGNIRLYGRSLAYYFIINS